MLGGFSFLIQTLVDAFWDFVVQWNFLVCWIFHDQAVAIKQLNRDGLQGNQEFIVEVLMLSLLHHSNLVNLLGYCAEGDQRLLVYEYMPMGSLEDHLFGKSLDWVLRFIFSVLNFSKFSTQLFLSYSFVLFILGSRLSLRFSRSAWFCSIFFGTVIHTYKFINLMHI